MPLVPGETFARYTIARQPRPGADSPKLSLTCDGRFADGARLSPGMRERTIRSDAGSTHICAHRARASDTASRTHKGRCRGRSQGWINVRQVPAHTTARAGRYGRGVRGS